MKNFLNILLAIILKPLTSIILYSGDDKFIRFVNKKKIIMVLFSIVFSALFIFLILILPYIF